MIDIELKHPIVTLTDGNKTTYGGNQMLSSSKIVRGCGCGAVSALDMLIYLSKHDPSRNGWVSDALCCDGSVPICVYDKELIRLVRLYLPLIPGGGINGVVLALGLNTYFLTHKMPYVAAWGVRSSKVWKQIENMLVNGIPVILSVGPNFPKLWGKKKLSFYMASDGRLIRTNQVRSHYVTVTGIGSEYMQVSSWGKKLYISKQEYMDYIKGESSSIVSNIMYIKRLKSTDGANFS